MESTIEKVRPTAAYELVADQVRRAIHIGRFLPGDKLPPERELANQLGVSRTTVREAIRVLEGEGLVESRRGATGGLRVISRAVSEEILRETMRARLEQIENVFDFRIANEVTAAGLAAERRSAADLAAMEAALDVMRMHGPDADGDPVHHVAAFRAADSDFHLAVASASRNPLLVRAVEDARAAMFVPIGAIFSRLEDTANEFHQEIHAGIEARDRVRAQESMRAHIESTRASVRSFAEPRRRTRATA